MCHSTNSAYSIIPRDTVGHEALYESSRVIIINAVVVVKVLAKIICKEFWNINGLFFFLIVLFEDRFSFSKFRARFERTHESWVFVCKHIFVEALAARFTMIL